MEQSQEDLRADLRLRPLNRQLALPPQLDLLLPDDHEARLVWAFVESLDFSELYRLVKARAHQPGAPVYDPLVLFALWLFATIEGVSSSRELAALCQRDVPYLWLCGGHTPSYHTLSSFYAEHEEFLAHRFQEALTVLLEQRLLVLKTVLVDGRKVPANASAESNHREPTLLAHRQAAEEHLRKLQEERAEAAGQSQKKAAAQKRAARERLERLNEAIDKVKQRQQERRETNRKTSPPEEARASETDPDARKMKTKNSGFELCYNVQTASDEATGLIVTVIVTEQGSDNGLLLPVLEKVEETLGQKPDAATTDAGFLDQNDIDQLEKKKIKVYMPRKNEKKDKKEGRDPAQRKRGDTDEVAAWRARMSTEEAQKKYKRRAPVAEGVHAQQSNRGFKRFRLRGLVKAQSEALWQALAHNFCVVQSLLRRQTEKLRLQLA